MNEFVLITFFSLSLISRFNHCTHPIRHVFQLSKIRHRKIYHQICKKNKTNHGHSAWWFTLFPPAIVPIIFLFIPQKCHKLKQKVVLIDWISFHFNSFHNFVRQNSRIEWFFDRFLITEKNGLFLSKFKEILTNAWDVFTKNIFLSIQDKSVWKRCSD